MMTMFYQNVGWFELQHVLEKLLGFVVQIVGQRARNFCLEFLKNCLFVVCQTVPCALKPEIPSWLSIVLLPEQSHSSWEVPMGCKGVPLWSSSYKGLHTPTVKLLQRLGSHRVLFSFFKSTCKFTLSFRNKTMAEVYLLMHLVDLFK